MPIPGPGAGPVGADATPDELRWRLVGAFRDGRYRDGSVVDIDALAAEWGVSTARLREPIDYLVTIGHAVREDDGSIRVTRPTIDDWADASRVMQSLLEATVRDAVPVLDDADKRALHELVERIRRQGALRDHGYTESSFALYGFFAERARNRLLRRLAQENLARVANALQPPPRFEQWHTGGTLLRLVAAVEDLDLHEATEAVHDLWPFLDRHLAEARARMEQ